MNRGEARQAQFLLPIIPFVGLLLATVSCRQPYGVANPSYPGQRPITDDERIELLEYVIAANGTPYKWGGDTLEGMDCSGLIQWAYRQMGYDWFLYDGEQLVRETTAHNLYHNNTEPVDSLDNLGRGDFIFFDESGDGTITHNSVLDRVDEEGNVWVYDAYSISGEVTHRAVDDFWEKGPLFGRPLVVVVD